MSLLQTVNHENKVYHYEAPQVLNRSLSLNDYVKVTNASRRHRGENCVICLDTLSIPDKNIANLGKCNHSFHLECLEESYKFSNKCPACRIPITEIPNGCQPSGTMHISLINQSCNGYPGSKTYQIYYYFPSGIQKRYHANPFIAYTGTSRIAYLPKNQQGSDLLNRLVVGFQHGLLFNVGTSITTGHSNVVTWGSIHHRTSMNGGAYGFSDAIHNDNYFINVNEDLDNLHVPKFN